MKLIYIGDHFYMESGTMMSPIYTEDGYRSDWGHVQMALKRGDSIEIRQATPQERDFYETRLSEIKREADDRVKRGVTKRYTVLADRREPIGKASSPKGDGRAAG